MKKEIKQKMNIYKKLNHMKKYLLIFAMLLLVAVSSWGRTSLNSRPVKVSPMELSPAISSDLVQWTLLTSKDSVKVYRAYIMCSGQFRIALKIENKSVHKVRVSWNSGFNVSGSIKAISLPFSFDVEANATLSGDCQKASLLFDPYLYVTIVQDGICDYTIQNLNILVL